MGPMGRPIYPSHLPSLLILRCWRGLLPHSRAAAAGLVSSSLLLLLLSPPFPSLSLSLHAAHVLSTKQSKVGTEINPIRDQKMMDSAEQQVIGIAAAAVEAGRPCCVECRTTTTPMWRGGPTGPRSLCNACGIRYRKKRRQELGLDNHKKPQQNQLQPQPRQQQPQQHQDQSQVPIAVVSDNKSSGGLQVVKKRRVLMGVEEAAILLMALSSSSRSTLLHG